ncbi:MAG: hypothetical protein COC24_014795 [Alphaproteobacteria bacterium]|nr:hypothetical protein [Alphaproteobacteria bacterium]
MIGHKFILGLMAVAIFAPIQVMAADMSAQITDAAWDGKTVPEGQQCNRFGGKAMSPTLNVMDIPAEADALLIAFDDRSYGPMNYGGHGQVIYNITKGVGQVDVPSIAPHTFDLPEGFELLAAHRGPNWDTAGAYMPPCSGGQGNEYVIVVKAVTMNGKKVDKALTKTDVPMGKY